MGPKVLSGEPLTAISVKIVKAVDLKNTDQFWEGVSDPYCIVQIPGKPSTRRQTETIDNDLNPVWNYESVIYAFDVGDNLSIQVFDMDFVGDGCLLGSTMLTSSQICQEGGFAGDLAFES